MKAKAEIEDTKNLYDYWGERLYRSVLDDSRIIINLLRSIINNNEKEQTIILNVWHIWRFVLLKKMGIQGQSLQDLAECALLHDNAVAQYIQEELQNDALRNGVTKLGRHCTIGEKILKNIPFHNDVSNVILYPPP